MATIIKERDLDAIISEINRLNGQPTEMTGHHIPGQFIRSSAYGGHKLERVTTVGGGVTSITTGYVSKRELYNQLQAILTGLRMK